MAKNKLPRQEVIPGVGDKKIQAIENRALSYAEIRDERQALTKREVDLKKKLMELMHEKGLTTYKRNGISVSLVVEQETVKVKVRAQDEEEDEEEESDLPEQEEEPEEEDVPAGPF